MRRGSGSRSATRGSRYRPRRAKGRTMSRRLYFDLETSPNIVLSFRVGRDLHIDHDNIVKERAVICIAYKWENDPRIYSFAWDKSQCDKAMLAKFVKIANQADEIVGHNGDRFDIRWLRTRCLFHRIPCMPEFTSIDTLKLARSGFNFNSNRLDYIGKFLGVGRKKDTGGFGLWKSVTLDNDRKALKSMVDYCERDVELWQRVHAELIPYTKNRTHRGVFGGRTKADCPECTSENTVINKRRISAAGVPHIVMQCKDCGKYFKVSETAKRKVDEDRRKDKARDMLRIETGQAVNRAINENLRTR